MGFCPPDPRLAAAVATIAIPIPIPTGGDILVVQVQVQVQPWERAGVVFGGTLAGWAVHRSTASSCDCDRGAYRPGQGSLSSGGRRGCDRVLLHTDSLVADWWLGARRALRRWRDQGQDGRLASCAYYLGHWPHSGGSR